MSCKKPSWSILRRCLRNYLNRLRKTTIEIIHDNRFRDLDSDLGSREFEADIPFRSYLIVLFG